MILSYDLIKTEDIATPTPVQETVHNNSQIPEADQSIDSSSQSGNFLLKKTHSISSDISKKEDYFLQKDLLNMINSFSVNDNDELIQRQSINSLIENNNNNNYYNNNNNNNNNNNSLNSEWNDKVIDIKEISPFTNETEGNKEKEDKDGDESKKGQRHETEEYYCNNYEDNEVYNDYDNAQSHYQSQHELYTNEHMSIKLKGTTARMTTPMTMSINRKAILNSYHTYNIYELAKCSYILSKDQKACLYLQFKLDENSEMVDLLYISLKDKIIDLMFGGFSNYFIQKLIEKLSINQIEEIIIQIINSNSFSILGLDPHGTRVIQKMIERVKNANKLLGIITKVLLQHINQFIIDSNANHIIIKYASIVKYPQNQVIYDYLVDNIIEVSHDKNACCALQKCIEVANDKQKDQLFSAIGQNANSMISDDFGNYALQFIIPFCNEVIFNQIINSFIDNADVFALNKYASNVIEKCLEYSHKDTKMTIIKKYMNEQSIMNLLFNKYGNYVLETILSYASEPCLSIILSFVEKYSNQLISQKYGQKFLMKLVKSYPQLRVTNPNPNPNQNTHRNNYNHHNNKNTNTMNNRNKHNSMMSELNGFMFFQQECYNNNNNSNSNNSNSNSNTNIINQGNYMINKKNIQSNDAVMMNYYNNQFNNNSPVFDFYNKNSPTCINQQPKKCKENENQIYHHQQLRQLQQHQHQHQHQHQQEKHLHQQNQHQHHQFQQQQNQKLLSKNNSTTTNKKDFNPMNINIAVNNYYTSPIYNYYCYQNGQSCQEKYQNHNKNNI